MKTLFLTLVIFIFCVGQALAGTYAVTLDPQGEQSMQSAISKWVKANTTKDGKTGIETIPPAPSPTEMIQKWVDEKIGQEFTAMQGERDSTFQQKLKSMSKDKLDKINAIMEGKL